LKPYHSETHGFSHLEDRDFFFGAIETHPLLLQALIKEFKQEEIKESEIRKKLHASIDQVLPIRMRYTYQPSTCTRLNELHEMM